MVSVTSRRIVTTFVGDRFPVDFGDVLTLRLLHPAAPAEPALADEPKKPQPESAEPERVSILSQTGRKSSASRKGVRASGRVSLETQSLRTLTDARVDSLPRIQSNFSTATASVRTTVDRLPGDIKANIHFRASYRRSSAVTTLNPQSIRVYKASIEKRFKSQPVSVEVGRFYNIYEDFSGYWDGAVVRYGNRSLGAGVAIGFEPTLSNEGFDPNLPKYTAFADFRTRGKGFRYDADVSVHEVRGRNEYATHDYFGVQHGLRSKWLLLDQDLQVNRDPESQQWMVTRFQTSANIPVTRAFRLTGRYMIRRPYYVWRTQSFMSARRDRITAGANLTIGQGVTGVTVTSNTYEGQDPYTTYSAFLNLRRTALAGIGFSSSVSYWTRDQSKAGSANVGLSKLAGPVLMRGRYRFYRTSLNDLTLTTHSVDSALEFRLPERITLSVQVQFQFGDTFQNTNVFTGLWKSF